MHEYCKSQNVYVNCYNTLKTFKLVWTSFCELKGSWVCNFMSKKIIICQGTKLLVRYTNQMHEY